MSSRINGIRARSILLDCYDFKVEGNTYYIPNFEIIDNSNTGKFKEVYSAKIRKCGTVLFQINNPKELEIIKDYWIGQRKNSVGSSNDIKIFLDKLIKTREG